MEPCKAIGKEDADEQAIGTQWDKIFRLRDLQRP
jgi:hypothetical protein